MFVLGVLVALGSAVAFAGLGLVTLFGGARSTREQVIPGFRPDRPGGAERALTIAAVWIPVLMITVFGVYSAIRILQMVLQAVA